MTYGSYGPFPLQFLIKIIEIWPMTAMGHFHYNSLSKSLKYDLWLLWAISFTIPYQNHWNMTYDSYGVISITIPYQNHWNMTYGCYGQFPLQFLIKIIEMWPVKAMGHFNYKSLSKSLKCEIWHLWAISFTIPYPNHWNMTYGSYGAFPLQFLIKIIDIWLMTAIRHFHYNSLSKSLKYDPWLRWAICFTIPF